MREFLARFASVKILRRAKNQIVFGATGRLGEDVLAPAVVESKAEFALSKVGLKVAASVVKLDPSRKFEDATCKSVIASAVRTDNGVIGLRGPNVHHLAMAGRLDELVSWRPWRTNVVAPLLAKMRRQLFATSIDHANHP